MLLERRKVSRKTPGDGRLEITKRSAQKCEKLGARFGVELGRRRIRARLGTMPCTCRGADNPHVHYFLEGPALKALVAGTEVNLELDVTRRLVRVVSSPAD